MTPPRTWVVGASSGIGAALAAELLHRGHRVAVSARRARLLAELAAGGMSAQVCDVTDAASVTAAAGQVTAALGGLDTVIYSAGVWAQMDVDAWDPSVIRRHLEVHVAGLALVIGAVLPGMLARGAGTIAVISSVAGYRGLPRAEAYGAAKAAQQVLLESLRADVTGRGVRVVTVCPGFVKTEMTAENVFPMPWLIDADNAARRIARGLERGAPEIVFPLPMMLTMKAARLLPVRLWAAVAGRATGRGAARARGRGAASATVRAVPRRATPVAPAATGVAPATDGEPCQRSGRVGRP